MLKVDGLAATGGIVDKTGADIVSFKRQVFLTVMSSLDFEECVHKLLKAGTSIRVVHDIFRSELIIRSS